MSDLGKPTPPKNDFIDLDAETRSFDFSLFGFEDAVDAVDWRNQIAMTPAGNQGKYQTCVAFSLSAMIEAHHTITTGNTTELSAGWIHRCIAKEEPQYTAPYPNTAYKLTDKKIPSASAGSYPWPEDACGIPGIVTAPAFVGLSGEDTLRTVLQMQGPVSAGMEAGNDFWNLKEDVIYKYEGKGAQHAVTLVGYNNTGKYWIAKNSMGTAWGGMQGYVRIAYGSCRIGEYPAVGISTASPENWS